MKQGMKAYQQMANSGGVVLEDKEAAFEQYKRRIYQIAHRLLNRVRHNPLLEFEDLVSYGSIGLLEAIERFDPERNNQFSTFADYRIRGAMLDAIRSLDDSSRYSREQAKEIEETKKSLASQLGREATNAEVADAMDMTVEEFHELSGKVQSISHISFDIEVDEGQMSLLDILADEDAINAEDLLLHQDFRDQVRGAIMELSQQKRDCVLLYYARNLNISEVAEVFSITPSRVSQILRSAREELKEKLRYYVSEYVSHIEEDEE